MVLSLHPAWPLVDGVLLVSKGGTSGDIDGCGTLDFDSFEVLDKSLISV